MMKNNYCTFYLVRHGETEWNRQEIIQGQQDSGLTKKGIKQAKKLAKVFKKIKFDQVFSSDLLRAHKTAKLITIEKKIIIKTTKLLRERFFGPYEGKKFSEIQGELRKLIQKMSQLPEKKLFTNKKIIESNEELISRLITFLRETALAYPKKKILSKFFLYHLGFRRS